MYFRKFIVEALKHTWSLYEYPSRISSTKPRAESSEISTLIYDVFGGEILKTRKKNGWHFYNQIEGERFDFTTSQTGKILKNNFFEDMPSSPRDTVKYFAPEDYSTFFARFVKSYEEVVGYTKLRKTYQLNQTKQALKPEIHKNQEVPVYG